MRSKKVRLPFADTKVAAATTRDQIQKLLYANGVTALTDQIMRDADRGIYALRFQIEQRMFRLYCPLGVDQQEEKARMRAFLASLKALFDAAKYGLLILEDVLLSWTEVKTPAGETVTVGDHVRPQITAKELPNIHAPMLTDGKGKA